MNTIQDDQICKESSKPFRQTGDVEISDLSGGEKVRAHSSQECQAVRIPTCTGLISLPPVLLNNITPHRSSYETPRPLSTERHTLSFPPSASHTVSASRCSTGTLHQPLAVPPTF
jgi:hypothetical protein